MQSQLGIRRNVYARNLSRILYNTPSVQHFKAGYVPDTDAERLHVRCVRCSADGKYLAAGDYDGTVRIYDLRTFAVYKIIEAHDYEVSCLDFTPQNELGASFLASGSRDRLVHVYAVPQESNENE